MSAISREKTLASNFRHERIDESAPCNRLTVLQTTDLTGNGREDVIVGGTGPHLNLSLMGARSRLPSLSGLRHRLGISKPTLFWYENPGWERHTISTIPQLEVGQALADVDGDGREDLIVGQGIHYNDVYWFEQPEDPREPWPAHLLTDAFEKYHDIAVGDLDGDGEAEVVILSQASETICYYDIPDDPFEEPWPMEHCHVVDNGRRIEGVQLADIDGDGRIEIIAGTNIYHRADGDGTDWTREAITSGWDDTRVATADLDGDGDLEVVLAEGDSPVHGTHPGRVAWFDPPDWEEHRLNDGLFCPHSLGIADFDGDGTPDIYVAEMGLGQHESPELYLYLNDGNGEFTEGVIARGIPTHEARVADLNGDGRPDIVGKPYSPGRHVDCWYNHLTGR